MIRDTWRAILVLVVGGLLMEASGLRQQPPAPAPAPQWGYQHQPAVYPVYANPEPDRPLRRIGAAFVELGDSMIGAIRR
jgi:hypothetical protein